MALQCVLAQIRVAGVTTRRVALDRAFFNVPVTQLLSTEHLLFVMPIVFRGRPPEK